MVTQLDILKIRENLAPGEFNHFLQEVFENMSREIENTANAFYSYSPPGSNDLVFGVDKIFSSVERTWVGIFNDSLKKADPTISSLQEFSVWSDELPEGRCDLLFDWSGKHFIVEAKSREYNKNWPILQYEDSFHHFLDQANGYYVAEQKYYHRDTYLMAIVFEWIRKGNLEKARTDITRWKEVELKDPHSSKSDFAALFYGVERGVFVYGRIVSAPLMIQLS